MPRKAQHKKLEVLNLLIGLVRKKQMQPGERFPSERELAAQLGVSRGQVRSALDELERQRRIRRHVGQGTYLREIQAWSPVFSLTFAEVSSPREVFAARLAVEPSCAAIAAADGQQRDLEIIEAVWNAGRAATTYGEVRLRNKQLHFAIAHASRNQLLIQFTEVLFLFMEQTQWGHLMPDTDIDAVQNAWRAHEDIVQAILRRDAELSAAVMRAHISHIRDRVIEPTENL